MIPSFIRGSNNGRERVPSNEEGEEEDVIVAEKDKNLKVKTEEMTGSHKLGGALSDFSRSVAMRAISPITGGFSKLETDTLTEKSIESNQQASIMGGMGNGSVSYAPFEISRNQLIELIDDRDIGLFDESYPGGVSDICLALCVNPTEGVSNTFQPQEGPLSTTGGGAVKSAELGSVDFQSVEFTLSTSKSKKENLDLSSNTMISGGVGSTSARPSLSVRQNIFGINNLPKGKSTSFFELVWEALHDKTLVMLMVAAAISLAVGIYEDISNMTSGLPVEMHWIEGVAIIFAIFVVVMVGALNNYQKELQFQKLNAKREDRQIKVIRDSHQMECSIFDLVVGDVVCLETGDILPADGLVLESFQLKMDESGATGESDSISKSEKEDIFLLSGTKVVEGIGKMIVIAVGVSSFNGRMMMSMRGGAKNTSAKSSVSKDPAKEDESAAMQADQREEAEEEEEEEEDTQTPLQHKLNILADSIARVGISASILMFVTLTIKYWVVASINSNASGDMITFSVGFKAVMGILIQCVTMVVVAVPEGLPMAVTLALAFATNQMVKDNNLVRVLSACETMGNATCICSDKTGTLTENKMTVVDSIILLNHFSIANNSLPMPNQTTESEQAAAKQSTSNSNGNSLAASPTLVPPHLKRLRSMSNSNTFAMNNNNSNANNNNSGPHFKRYPLVKWSEAVTGSASVRDLLVQSIALNCTATENTLPTGKKEFNGNKTEIALLNLIFNLGRSNTASNSNSNSNANSIPTLEETRRSFPIARRFPFTSERKSMSTIVKIADNHYRIFIKGASEIILVTCSHAQGLKGELYRMEESAYSSSINNNNSNNNNNATSTSPILSFKGKLDAGIIKMAQQALRTIAVAYQDIYIINKMDSSNSSSYPQLSPVSSPQILRSHHSTSPHSSTQSSALLSASNDGCWIIEHLDQLNDLDYLLKTFPNSFILLAIFGIEDPLRSGVREAIQQCQRAGVFVRMVTGDNVVTASAIAKKCGILSRGGLVLEGPKFRRLSDSDLFNIVPRLQVLARSSPLDKQKLVHILKEMGEIVAVTGDGTNDGPALKMADIGFSMGIAGTEVAKEASSIILMDDHFGSIVKALAWGRCINDAVRKFLQFQLSVNATAMVVTFVSALMDSESTSALSAVELLWVNLIMDTFAALALATDGPDKKLLERRPESRHSPLINASMWKMIIGQCAFQILINLLILNLGNNQQLFPSRTLLRTFTFNTFVFLQLFNEINCRKLSDLELNVFSGMRSNRYFLGVMLLSVLGQFVLVTFGGKAIGTVPLSPGLWLVSIAIGFLTLPVGLVIRLLPIYNNNNNNNSHGSTKLGNNVKTATLSNSYALLRNANSNSMILKRPVSVSVVSTNSISNNSNTNNNNNNGNIYNSSTGGIKQPSQLASYEELIMLSEGINAALTSAAGNNQGSIFSFAPSSAATGSYPPLPPSQTSTKSRIQWNSAIQDIRTELRVYQAFRGPGPKPRSRRSSIISSGNVVANESIGSGKEGASVEETLEVVPGTPTTENLK